MLHKFLKLTCILSKRYCFHTVGNCVIHYVDCTQRQEKSIGLVENVGIIKHRTLLSVPDDNNYDNEITLAKIRSASQRINCKMFVVFI